MAKSETGFGWVAPGVFLVILLFLLTIVGPGYKSGAIHAMRRACYANIRTVTAQVEMHLLTGGTASSALSPDGTVILPPSTPGAGPAICPFGGVYKLGGTGSDTYVYCTFHGDTDDGGPVPGNLDPGYSPLWWMYRFFRDFLNH